MFVGFFLGIFAPISKIAKPGSAPRPRSPAVSPHKSPVQRAGSVDVSNIKARVDTGNTGVQIQVISVYCSNEKYQEWWSMLENLKSNHFKTIILRIFNLWRLGVCTGTFICCKTFDKRTGILLWNKIENVEKLLISFI